ncbi:hypothetical protein [Terribacillus saccharophilus]|uniref:hypothetical protein n=1 Tax=Terribacillus saccharophilus TaxID=361277 RepID=UPI002989C53E|nr:hypothetical protein [Terribacillus saccharophilus]MCM3227516.1 hypothetical protein [Terribacillus saccharophilus]
MLTFDNKLAGTIQIEKHFSEDDICSIVVGAMEGGISYWAVLEKDEHWDDKPNEEPASTWATKLLLEKKTIKFSDVEDPAEVWKLSLDKLLNGIKQNATYRPEESDLEQADAGTYDRIFQYALFNKIEFG